MKLLPNEFDLMRSFGEQVSELLDQANPPFWQANSVRWHSKVGTADMARAVAEFQQTSRDALGIDPAEWLWDQVSWMSREENSQYRRYDDVTGVKEPVEALFGFAEHSDGLEWLPKDKHIGLLVAPGRANTHVESVTSDVALQFANALLRRFDVDWAAAGFDDAGRS